MPKTKKSRIEIKKEQKEAALFNAGYELFISKGVSETTIGDIVKAAGVAKGTFYLYYEDKQALLDKIIINKASEVLHGCYREVSEKDYEHFEDLVIALIDRIIEVLRLNQMSLSLIHKNINWSLYRKALSHAKIHRGENLLDRLKHDEFRYQRNLDVSDEEFERRMFIVLELTSATAFSAVVQNEPCGIDELKPTLYEMIRKMLRTD